MFSDVRDAAQRGEDGEEEERGAEEVEGKLVGDAVTDGIDRPDIRTDEHFAL